LIGAMVDVKGHLLFMAA